MIKVGSKKQKHLSADSVWSNIEVNATEPTTGPIHSAFFFSLFQSHVQAMKNSQKIRPSNDQTTKKAVQLKCISSQTYSIHILYIYIKTKRKESSHFFSSSLKLVRLNINIYYNKNYGYEWRWVLRFTSIANSRIEADNLTKKNR